MWDSTLREDGYDIAKYIIFQCDLYLMVSNIADLQEGTKIGKPNLGISAFLNPLFLCFCCLIIGSPFSVGFPGSSSPANYFLRPRHCKLKSHGVPGWQEKKM
ncbi:uncharacterized protein LOC114738353 [Neltuma alba]|uniref:uncharacterized protein LOC114738353 n=1 Tax=Neltuma alba TaxID=207710 RepID=UPI0010A524C4|nr:uncharacterized protein LOC114738353 [Prosopis alba]